MLDGLTSDVAVISLENRSQLLHPTIDRARLKGCKSKRNARDLLVAEGVGVEPRCVDAMDRGLTFKFERIDGRVEEGGCCESGLNARQAKGPSDMFRGRVIQRMETFGVGLAHASNMPAEMALRDEVCENRLIDRIGPEVGVMAKTAYPVNQIFVHDHVAKAK